MTEQDIKTAVAELADMTMQGNSMDAFEKFYAEDLEKADLDGVVVTGKAANRQIGLDLIAKITAVRDFSCRGSVVSGNRAFVVWHIDFDHTDWGPTVFNEVAIQDWQDGKIVRERFFA
jgi:ketosteroid isomerase-like protein